MSIRADLDFCEQHRELSDLLIEHGCAPAGEDRELLRALVEREERRQAVDLWRCPEHGWTHDFHYASAWSSPDKRPRCPSMVDRDDTCGKLLEGPFEARVSRHARTPELR